MDKTVKEKFYELCDDTIEKFEKICSEKAFPNNITFAFVGTDNQKKLIKVSKIPDQYQFLLKEKMVLVSINEDKMNKYDNDELIDILFEQEIDRIYYDTEHDKLKFIEPDLITTSGILNKYGIEKVSRANQVELLYNEQESDDFKTKNK